MTRFVRRQTVRLMVTATWSKGWMVLAASLAAAWSASPAPGQWSSPVNLSNSPNHWSVDACMDFDAAGHVHLIYRDWWNSSQYLYYMENMTGVWSQRQLVANATDGVLRITPDHVVHVFYKWNSNLWETSKPVGTANSSTPVRVNHEAANGDCWPAWAAVDASGGLYFSYIHLWDDGTSTPSALWGRYKPLGGNWGPTELIENGSDRDHWPAESQLVSNGNNIYATWEINPGSGTVPRYKKRQNGVWGFRQQIDSSGGAARLAFSASGEMAAGWSKDIGGSAWYEVFVKFSTDGGSTWSSAFTVSDNHDGLDRTPEITFDASGSFHVVYQRFDCDGCQPEMWYRSRSSAGVWQTKYNLTNTAGRTGAGFQCIRAWGNVLHFLYTDNTDNGIEDLFYKTTATSLPPDNGTIQGVVTNLNQVPLNGATVVTSPGNFAAITGLNGAYAIIGVPVGTYTVTATKPYHASASIAGVVVQQNLATIVNPAIEGIPPDNASAMAAAARNTAVHLTWTNSLSPNLTGILIRFKTTGYPSGPTDGTLVIDRPAVPGSNDSWDHDGLTDGLPHYYRAFAYYEEGSRYYASGSLAVATPAVAPDFDHDGDVDQVDFGHFQLCLSGEFVSQDLSDCQDAKLDTDDDVDQEDWAIFMNCISGPGAYADPACAD